MSTLVQLFEVPTNAADTSADVSRANIVDLPFGKARYQITHATRKNEMLRQGIDLLRRSIRELESVVGLINDDEMRQELQRELNSMDEMLVFRSTQLSSIDHMLKVTLRRAGRSRR